MNLLAQSRRSWQDYPIISLFVSEWQVWRKECAQPHFCLAQVSQDASELRPYPLDMDPLLALPHGNLDEAGVPYNEAVGTYYPAAYQPTTIAQYALGRWNAYLNSRDKEHLDSFMIQARWFVEHEVPLANAASGWPIPFAARTYNTPPMWLSAMTQGSVISVLVRAYKISGEDLFLQVARRAVRTFELETRDGGVAVSLGNDGVFFEEVASDPPSHILNGYIFALFGLYDYVAYTGDIHIDALIKRSLYALHTIIDKFDMGYWSRYDLLFRTPATLFYHALHVTLFEALAQLSGCPHCAVLAARWDKYQKSYHAHLKYFIVSRIVRYHSVLKRRVSRLLYKYSSTTTRA